MKLSLAVATAFLALGVSAAVAMPYTVPRQQMTQTQQQVGPAQVLRQGVGKLIAFMGQPNRPEAAQIQAFLDSEIAPYFDFNYMARWVAGPKHRSMNAAQREEMKSQLEAMFLGTLAKRLGGFDNQKVRVLRPRRGQGNEVTVGVGILKPGGYPAKMDFRFYRSEDGWKVFDVAANGSSALVYYRQQFNRSLRQRRAPAWGRRL